MKGFFEVPSFIGKIVSPSEVTISALLEPLQVRARRIEPVEK